MGSKDSMIGCIADSVSFAEHEGYNGDFTDATLYTTQGVTRTYSKGDRAKDLREAHSLHGWTSKQYKTFAGT